MCGFTDEYDQERHEEAYGEGFEEAQEAGFWDDVFHGLDEIISTVVPGETTEHQSHEQGYRDGREEKGWW